MGPEKRKKKGIYIYLIVKLFFNGNLNFFCTCKKIFRWLQLSASG